MDIAGPPDSALDVLIELGALDVEPSTGGLAAILPDSVQPAAVARALRGAAITISTAQGRDSGSVWLVSARTLHAGGIMVVPAGIDAPEEALRLADSGAFGTGHHPTTALCLEALAGIIADDHPRSILDVGTGSGILALAALLLGVDRATAIDIDRAAIEAAAANARLNQLHRRLRLITGTPDTIKGTWPLVVANVLAAPLIEMASVLVRRLEHRGRLILSGIPRSLEAEVRLAYRHLGVHCIDSQTRDGWTALIGQASW
ncbi:50S ribosomal protein L11 methyltransferase [uncultured Paludibaculum sp.]|uniref:50S ribosomal protein L11 methyltransferase n=1 Tax=uncultured Paludibaculum sp. TaxID=1765020 RepID=UPI002AAAC64B|nr:50S ribosomal protein L11 methyltransferase [uncultured Paludibaculum sp.]